MPAFPFLRSRVLLAVGSVLVVALLAGVGIYLGRSRPQLPAPGSPAYEEYAEAFQVGTAALDSDLLPMATEKLNLAIEKIPQEPAAWANRGLMHLRGNQLDKAAADLQRASALAPGNANIEELLGYLAERK